MTVRGVAALSVAAPFVATVVAFPVPVFAYRPFDATDAAVADKGVFEVELSPLSYRHDDDGIAWIAPQARLNYGFAQDWEAVLEGQAEHSSRQSSRVTEAAFSLKSVLQEGSLQDKAGWSLASEESVLLPGINAQDGAGFQWTGIASQRWDWGSVHLNLAAELTRDRRFETFGGIIVEGPGSWPVRPVTEVTYQREFRTEEQTSVLLGAIWKVDDHLDLDLGFRHAWVNRRPDEQVRAGITLALN
ncbi:MAG TPA: hypothetical protein VN175_04890 [Rhizomicrobium sp.]|nr:hypothetical protein [Rhizomicrobium sp.]